MSNEMEIVADVITVVPPNNKDTVGYLNGFDLQVGDHLRVQVSRLTKKKLDWSKMPKDTLLYVSNRLYHLKTVCDNEILCTVGTTATSTSFSDYTVPSKLAKLAPEDKQPWNVWFGGECPLPEGVMVEVVDRTGKKLRLQATDCRWIHRATSMYYGGVNPYDIIAYKIIGLAEGWDY